MKLWKVTVRNRNDKKIDLIRAKTPYSALNKIQKAPNGWHWKECTYSERSKKSCWCASVRTDDEFHNFLLIELVPKLLTS